MPTDTESHKNKTQIKTKNHKIQGTNIQNTENKKRRPCKEILNERNLGIPIHAIAHRKV